MTTDTRSMDERLRAFIDAADELYSACCDQPKRPTARLDEAMAAFAKASNEWPQHPGKIDAALRRTQSEAAQHAQSGVVEAFGPMIEMQNNPDCPNCGKGLGIGGTFNADGTRESYHMTPNGFPLHHAPLKALATPSPAVAESELREDREALDGVNAHEHWGASVDTHGDEIVRIETAMLAGKADLSEQDLATIRTAARHLLSFAGPPRLCPTQTEKDNG